MYIDKCVYNALSRFARRIKKEMITIWIALATTMIPLSFFLLTTSAPHYLSWVAATIGFTSLIIAVFLANKADKETKYQGKRLIKLLEAIARKMGVDIKDV